MDQLSDAGLLVRAGDGNDRRVKILALTEAGMQKVEMIEQAFAPFRRELLKDVTKADIEACQRVLDAPGKAVSVMTDRKSSNCVFSQSVFLSSSAISYSLFLRMPVIFAVRAAAVPAGSSSSKTDSICRA